ncbi:hypothetical protein [Paenibacillus sp. FSL W7-1287]|uniref:hypothetical protein n=1 Tax=Paenibacillus sp. FSL W7-1287 TaxID=2954538 RepID=UPI0030F72BC5
MVEIKRNGMIDESYVIRLALIHMVPYVTYNRGLLCYNNEHEIHPIRQLYVSAYIRN